MKIAKKYSGKKVFVGIDVHKRSYSVSCMVEGQLVHQFSTKANAAELTRSLRLNFKGAQLYSTYEAGFSGFVLHRQLETAGISNIVVNPASVETASNSRVKTDKIDSKKLAKQLSMNNLTGIHVPTPEEEEARQLHRTRSHLVEDRVAIGNRIKGKLTEFGYLTAENDQKMSNVFLKNVEKMTLLPLLKLAISSLINIWRHMQKQILQLERAMRKYNNGRGKLHEIVRSVPGVGPISANIIMTELGDMSRFKNEGTHISRSTKTGRAIFSQQTS